MDWLPWVPLAAASLHIREEFVVPGGFPSRITGHFLLIVDAALLLACVNIGMLARTPMGVVYWLVIAALLCSNGLWHAWASCRSRTYSPGVITGMTIYLPMAIYGYTEFLRSGAASAGMAIAAAAAGGSYHFWSAACHKRFRVAINR